MASLALRYAVAGHAASASVDAAVVTRLCVSVSLASIALPAPPCVAAGVRLATAAGLTSSTRLTAGVAPAVAAALDGAAGASPPEAAAALFSRVLFLTPPPAEAEDEDEDEDDSGSEPNENREGGDSFASSRRSAREPDARAAILDVACGALSALPEDDGVAGSLDEFAILTCALLSWPSIGAAPDAARSRAAVQMVTGLGVAAFGPVAARFAALERGEYSSDSALESKSDPLEKRHRGKRASPVTRTHNRHNRRAFFRDACRAMGEAGCTSAQAWAQRCARWRRRRRRPSLDADARLAAADLLVAWLDARVHAEGKGAWETKALAAAASELVDMDDAALAPACSALARARRHRRARRRRRRRAPGRAHAARRRRERRRQGAPGALGPGRRARRGRRRQKSRRRSARAGEPPRARARVRGVSVAGEDRLRRWARTWLADAAADAENLLAGTARGAAASTPKGSRHLRAEDARARARASRRLRIPPPTPATKPPSRRASTRPARSCWWAASRQTARRRRRLRPPRARLWRSARVGRPNRRPFVRGAQVAGDGREEKRLGDAHAGARETGGFPFPESLRVFFFPAGNPKRGFDARVAGGHEPGDVPPRAPPGARAGRSVRANTRDCRDCRERRAHRRLALAPRPAGTKRRREKRARPGRRRGEGRRVRFPSAASRRRRRRRLASASRRFAPGPGVGELGG